MEGWVKCLMSQNTSGVSGINSVAAKSNTIEVNGDHFFKCKKKQLKKPNMPPCCSCGVVQVSVSPDFHIQGHLGVNDTVSGQIWMSWVYGHLDDAHLGELSLYGLRRCWTHRPRPSGPCSSRRTTSRWLWWRGWHSSGCARRPAAGWSPSPSSWTSHWTRTGPPTGRRSPCRWCPARCAPRGRCSGGRSCRAGRSRPLTEGRPGCLLWRCSPRSRRGRSSSPGRPGNTSPGSLCLSDKLKGESQWVSGVSVTCFYLSVTRKMLNQTHSSESC